MENPDRAGSRLLELALGWLELDREARVAKEISRDGKQRRGAGGKTVTDSEEFYRKYDYGH